MQRRYRERFSFALLPGQALAGDQIQRGIHHMEWFPRILQGRHIQVVILTEPGEPVDLRRGIRCSQVSADQPFTVHGVQ